MPDQTPVFCRRCACELMPGAGDFFVVRITSVADPSPPTITQQDLESDHEEIMRKLLHQLEGFSEQELMDMVHRRLVFFLCARCHQHWIEDPTGG